MRRLRLQFKEEEVELVIRMQPLMQLLFKIFAWMHQLLVEITNCEPNMVWEVSCESTEERGW